MALVACGSMQAQGVIAVRGGTVHTAAGPPMANATIVARDGKIAALGVGIAIPAGATVYDATGRTVVPGMLDEHSHIGAKPSDINDRPMVIGPQHRVLDALDLQDVDWVDEGRRDDRHHGAG
jgi:imidazolonepropionase-like amidohydrolase